MKKGDVPVLNQLIKSLEENLLELEQAHKNKDPESFNNTKKVIKQLQGKIVEVIK